MGDEKSPLFEKQERMNLSLVHYKEEERKVLSEYLGQIEGCCDRPEVLLGNFTRFARTQDITRFMVLSELFRQILPIHGQIVELGVLEGFSLFALAHLSEIFEHRNYIRQIIGFDTFEGLTGLSETHDRPSGDFRKVNSPKTSSLDALRASVDLFNRSIAFNQFEKIKLVKGDARSTIPAYAAEHPELVVSMLLCHCDIYEPTLVALETLYPRIPRGGIVVLGNIGSDALPGETRALFEAVGVDSVKLKRFPFHTKHSYFVKGE